MLARTALAHRGYRIFWSGSILTFTAQWIQQVAIGWVVLDLTGSSAALGFTLALRAVPMFLLAPFSGVAADRYDRRNLLIGAQLTMAVATGVIAFALGTGRASLAHLVLFMLVVGAASVFDRNARHAIVLDLVPRELAASAVGLNTMVFSGARIAAPAIAGFLFAWLGAAANFWLQAIVYCLVTLTLLAIRLPKREPAARTSSAWGEMRAGLRFACGDPMLRLLLLTGVLPYFFLYPVWGVLFPVLARDVYHVGPQGLGVMLTTIGAGGFLGGLLGGLAGRLGRAGLIQIGALAVLGTGLAGIAFAPTMWSALPFIVLAGFGEMVHTVINTTLVQLAAPQAMRGRITSIMAIFPAFISLGALWVGNSSALIGTRTTIGIAGAFAMLGAVVLILTATRLRGLRMSDLGAGR